MPNILKIKSFTLNMKVALALFLLSIFLLSVLFLLIVPKMQKEQFNYAKEQIEKMTLVIKEQVLVAGKAINIQSKLEKSETKYKLALELKNIQSKASDFQTAYYLSKNSFLNKHCFFEIKNSFQTKNNIDNNKLIKLIKNPQLNIWQNHEIDFDYKTLDRKKKYFSYSVKLAFNDTLLSILCNSSSLNKNHGSFEDTIKINVQKTFSLTQNLHKGKTYLMWINPKIINEDSRVLYEENYELRKKRYSISNMSNVENIHTGNLSAKQIIQAMEKEPILHDLNGKKALTWVKNLNEKGDTYISLLITTVNLEDLHDHQDSVFWKILPASVIALFLAIILGLFIFKRMFKSINILAKTAKKVNRGNKKIRSNVKGNDDIGYLGIAFDSMLDSLQNNIETLDSKVENKTKELKHSLEEKEILLKEIHHRVKNNLALTISLIKLQQIKIKDEKTKKILKDIQERIYTMELLHRKLYESTNLNCINFKEYINSLILDISNTYEYEKEVQIDISMEDIQLDIQTAMPCGLILNEITTNAFKYAFKDNKKPQLFIKMYKEDKKYHLLVKDNGKGISKDVDIYKSNSLGLKLINSISKLQLKGDFEYIYEKGAVFKISFKY